MSHTIESSRFGRLEIADEAVIRFPAGLIGIPGERYTLLARSDDAPFVWLHSLDDPSLAVPVTNPFRWFADYEVELSDEEAARIGIADPSDADVWVTVRAGARAEDFSANLLAPILVTRAGIGERGSRGWQVINDAPGAPVRASLFEQPAQQVA